MGPDTNSISVIRKRIHQSIESKEPQFDETNYSEKKFFLHFIDLLLNTNKTYDNIVYPSSKLIKIDRSTPIAPLTANRVW